MTVFKYKQLETHAGKLLFTFLCFIVILSFYHLHDLPSRTLHAGTNKDHDVFGSIGPTTGQKHPIEILVKDARRRYTHMVENQSKSLTEAIANYKKRYRREPPPGFEDWYHVAVRLNATIIDNYDSVMASFEPYWSISARELRARVREALDPGYMGGRVLGIRVKDNRIETLHEKTAINHYHFDVLKDRMEPFLQFLPDMEYMYNPFDEPMVFAPHDVLSKAVSDCALPDNDTKDPWEISTRSPKHVYFNLVERQRTWEMATRSCPLGSPSRSGLSSQPLQKTATNEQLLFPQNITHIRNVCELPEAGDTHGIFLSPGSIWHTNTLVPIFSRAKLSTNQDLMMPATDYSSSMTYYYKPYNESEDIPWDEKENRLYWTGGTTDGNFHDDSWRTSHRFRLVKDLNNKTKPISLLRKKDGAWESHKSTMGALSKYIHVKFSDVSHCSKKECDRIKDPAEGLAFTSREGLKASYSSRFAFDIDGTTYTERFQRLLQSHNTVFKMTIFQEWHDDFLVPWVHYVPVSLGMKELPETLRFFVETQQGQEIGREIAEEGRRWMQQAWRPVDMKIALFRILLEYARLWGPDRDKTGECPWDREG